MSIISLNGPFLGVYPMSPKTNFQNNGLEKKNRIRRNPNAIRITLPTSQNVLLIPRKLRITNAIRSVSLSKKNTGTPFEIGIPFFWLSNRGLINSPLLPGLRVPANPAIKTEKLNVFFI